MPDTYAEAKADYEAQAEAFTALNLEVNASITAEAVTDEQELAFFKAEKALKDAYQTMQRLKIAEIEGSN